MGTCLDTSSKGQRSRSRKVKTKGYVFDKDKEPGLGSKDELVNIKIQETISSDRWTKSIMFLDN